MVPLETMPNNEFESRSAVELPPPVRLEGAIAQPFRVYRDKLAISMNDFITGSTGHQTCSGLQRSDNLLTNHQFSFVHGVTATGHQLHHPKGDHTTGGGASQAGLSGVLGERRSEKATTRFEVGGVSRV